MHPGTRIGPYAITVSIGAGGMGEVFRARDTRLNRDVAIKVLPKDFQSLGVKLVRRVRILVFRIAEESIGWQYQVRGEKPEFLDVVSS